METRRGKHPDEGEAAGEEGGRTLLIFAFTCQHTKKSTRTVIFPSLTEDNYFHSFPGDSLHSDVIVSTHLCPLSANIMQIAN